MKGRLLLLLLAIAFFIPSFAQKHGDKDREAKRKEMTEFKLKFIADEMGLKDDQRKQFMEVYGQMESERRAIFHKIKTAEKQIKDNKNATEADYEKANQEITEARDRMAAIDKKYDEKFATFLSKKQIYRMKEAENKFSEKIRLCRDKKKDGKPDKK